MNKRIFVTFVVFLSLFVGKSVQADFVTHTAWVRVIDMHTSLLSQADTKTKKNISKKDIKKELKRRKNFHKSLVIRYNQAFESHVLKYIQKNTQKIELLQTLLYHYDTRK